MYQDTIVRKRYRIKSKVRFSIFVITVLTIGILIGAFVFGWAFNRTLEASGAEETRYATVTVISGDTLWDIATAYAPAGTDVRSYIREICRTNDLDSQSVYEGQTLQVPIYT
ncbi:MAG: LysM peptidoglycan-binding domain-containing protein [Clostridiales Family XIII bacterium]|nr:LysM peptidoglycan-binding domain-containing protein [Clostridiales Family XIII bacterium]